MGNLTLQDAAIALDDELDQIAAKFGLFATAEETTMQMWVQRKRAELLDQIRKTRRELQRLDNSLQRLEGLAVGRFGEKNSPADFRREYVALEGWTLTAMSNYLVLAALGGEFERRDGLKRANDYTAGTAAMLKNHPNTAGRLRTPVLDYLRDMTLLNS